jgi:hypothetical protein
MFAGVDMTYSMALLMKPAVLIILLNLVLVVALEGSVSKF